MSDMSDAEGPHAFSFLSGEGSLRPLGELLEEFRQQYKKGGVTVSDTSPVDEQPGED